MELKDMTFPQVLQLEVFHDELLEQMTRELVAYEKASTHGKLARMALTRLRERGEFDAEKLTAAYYHIMHKEAVCLSARERQYITDVCTLAYSRTIRRLQNESEENSRNPLLRLVRWVLAKWNIKTTL